jgi:superfamily I DNA/RNA helicase
MSDDELEQVIRKRRMLKELRRARERVRQLERKLRGAPAKPEESPWVPEFLRRQVSSGPPHLTSAHGQTPADDETNHPTRAVSQLRSARRVPESLSAGGPRAT